MTRVEWLVGNFSEHFSVAFVSRLGKNNFDTDLDLLALFAVDLLKTSLIVFVTISAFCLWDTKIIAL